MNRFNKNVLMPFFVLGDPDYSTSIRIIKAAIDNGADALELGFAFSDPIADGPAVQKANMRALENGMTTKKAFNLLKQIRRYSNIPISLMLSFNIIYRYGIKRFYRKCRELNIDAILCVDLSLEESGEVIKSSKSNRINQVFIVCPTTDNRRINKIYEVCSGYIYLVSLMGVTGERKKVDAGLNKLIKRVKQNTVVPIYVGFGISNPRQAKEVISAGADGVVIGSAIANIIERNIEKETNHKNSVEKKVEMFIRQAKDGMRI